MFEVEDVVYYKKDLTKPYTIIATNKIAIYKDVEKEQWQEVYIYYGVDKNTEQGKFFIRNKEDFEKNFVKYSLNLTK